MNLKNNPQVQIFLDQACRGVRSRQARAQIRAELLDHLSQALEEGRNLDSVIHEFGDPTQIAKQLSLLHRPFYLEPIFVGTIGVGIAVVAIAAMTATLHLQYRQMNTNVVNVIDKHREIFFEDQKILAENSFFQTPGKTKDAGPFLNPQVEWTVGDAESKHRFAFLNRSPHIVVPAKIGEALKQKNWTTLVNSGLDNEVPLDWMKQLAPYDHWDLFAWEPMKPVMQDLSATPWWSFPIPNLNAMTNFAKLRLLRGLRTGQMQPALKEVRQLAQLVYSNETTMGSMVSVAILNIEREAYEQALSKHLMLAADWTPVSQETTVRARRAMFAYSELLQLGTAPENFLATLKKAHGTAGYCNSLAEAGISMAFAHDIAGERVYPMELNWSDYFAQMENLIEDSPCRLNFAKNLLQQRGATRNWFHALDEPQIESNSMSALTKHLKWKLATEVPWIRQWAVFGFQNLVPADYMTGAYANNRLPGE